jgi:hypothetical protein
MATSRGQFEPQGRRRIKADLASASSQRAGSYSKTDPPQATSDARRVIAG